MHPHTLANLFAKSIARYTLVTKRTCSPRVVGYRQSMLQHAKDLEGFAPQTYDQGSPLDGLSLRRFETQVSKLQALAGRQEQTVVCSMPRGFGCNEVVNPNLLLILPSVRYRKFRLTTAKQNPITSLIKNINYLEHNHPRLLSVCVRFINETDAFLAKIKRVAFATPLN